MSKVILSAQHLVKTYSKSTGTLGLAQQTIKALDDVSIEIKQGQTLAVVGESGSGKSTLARCIMQLQSIDSGEIHFLGQDLAKCKPAELRETRKHLQMVFQDPFASLNPRMRVGEIVAEGLVIHRIGNRKSQQEATVQMLEQVGLQASDADKYPHQFSGGQRQRIGIARALILKPKVVICDEPVSALDVSVQAQILTLLKSLQQSLGLSYLFISHDLRVVRHIADDIVVMQKGKVIEQGSIENIYNAPQQLYTQQLLHAIPGRARVQHVSM